MHKHTLQKIGGGAACALSLVGIWTASACAWLAGVAAPGVAPELWLGVAGAGGIAVVAANLAYVLLGPEARIRRASERERERLARMVPALRNGRGWQ